MAKGHKTAKSRRPPLPRRAQKPAATPAGIWWLAVDVEFCIFCHHRYAYGTGYRCLGCDAAVCAFCVVERGKEYWCPAC